MNSGELLMTHTDKININDIPTEEVKALSRCLLTSIREFYENPENVEKFNEWEMRQNKVTA